MTKKISYCVHHSDVVATAACFRCGNPICFNCELNLFGRKFCSGQCAVIFIFRAFFKVIFWPLTPLRKFSGRGWLELFMFSGLAVCLFFIWKLNREIKAIGKEGKTSAPYSALADTAASILPKVMRPTEGGMVFSNTLSISGQAESNRIISLSVDGKLKQVLLPEKGQFLFKNVRLHRGNNQIEVHALSEKGDVSTLQILTLHYASPTLTYLTADFRRGLLNRKQVALTFDGGSINNVADEILDVLKDKGVKCTFFLTGNFIKNYPQTVKRIASEGHEVGSHTWNHPHLTSFAQDRKHITLPHINSNKLKSELNRAASQYKISTGREMVPLWRAPYGEYNEEILKWAAAAGYKHIGWTVGRGWEENMDTMDWVTDKNSQAYHTSDEILEKLLKHGKGKKNGSNGAIILMHLGTNRKDDFPHKKLPQIITELEKMGYELVKITDMLSQN